MVVAVDVYQVDDGCCGSLLIPRHSGGVHLQYDKEEAK